MYNDIMDDVTIRIIIQIILSAFLGLVVGLEREYKKKPAGMRTYALVALGATLFTILSVEGFAEFSGGELFDPSRVAAQVVVGIGFLGAGLIFVDRGSVQGLTTAAGLWATAAMGMAVGLQFYTVAIVSTVLILLILWAVRKAESRIGVPKATIDSYE